MRRGQKHTEEARKKIKIARKRQCGPLEPALGHCLSKEARKRISEKLKGNKLSNETKEKISRAHKGRKNMWAKKISKTLMGHSVSEETRQKISIANKGKLAGKDNPAKRPEAREKIRLSKLGEKNANWKGGITKNRDGYEFIRIGNFYISTHRLTMKQMLRRKLRMGEVVHHINKNYKDNRKENLALCSNISAHQWCHTEEAKIFFG